MPGAKSVFKFIVLRVLEVTAIVAAGIAIHKYVTNRQAAQETAAFVSQNMAHVPALADRFALLAHSIRQVGPETKGHFCEFGVASGISINHIASLTDREIHGFDSFEGLPEDWRAGFGKGAFSQDGLPPVRTNVRLYKGWFDQTVPAWAKEHPGPMAFIHMDADLYSSTKTVLDALADRIVPGTVIQFDEFFNYPGWQEGEFKAFTEFVAKHQIGFEYIGYSQGGDAQQAAVRIRSVGSAARN